MKQPEFEAWGGNAFDPNIEKKRKTEKSSEPPREEKLHEKYKHEIRILILVALIAFTFLIRSWGESLISPADLDYLNEALKPSDLGQSRIMGGVWFLFPIYATPVFLIPYFFLTIARWLKYESWTASLEAYDLFLMFPFVFLSMGLTFLHAHFSKNTDNKARDDFWRNSANAFAGIFLLSFQFRFALEGLLALAVLFVLSMLAFAAISILCPLVGLLGHYFKKKK